MRNCKGFLCTTESPVQRLQPTRKLLRLLSSACRTLHLKLLCSASRMMAFQLCQDIEDGILQTEDQLTCDIPAIQSHRSRTASANSHTNATEDLRIFRRLGQKFLWMTMPCRHALPEQVCERRLELREKRPPAETFQDATAQAAQQRPAMPK